MISYITWFDIDLYSQAVELDPVIVDIAREYFSFVEDKRLKVVNKYTSIPRAFSVCLSQSEHLRKVLNVDCGKQIF